MRKDTYQEKRLVKAKKMKVKVKIKRKLLYSDQGSFYSKLSMLYKSGIAFIRSLELIMMRTKKKALRLQLKLIIDDIKEGMTISNSFQKNGSSFHDFGLYILSVGEESGQLEEVLNKLSEFYMEKHQNRKNIREALSYPKFLIVITVLVMNLIMLNILPSFYMLVEGSENIPGFTTFIVNISIFLSKYKVSVISIQIFLFLSGVLFFNSKFFLENKGKIFPFNMINKKLQILNLYHCFSLMLSSGISIIEVINISENIFKNLDIKGLKEKFNNNYSISESLKECEFGNDDTFELLQVGEESGNLDNMFDKGYTILKEDFKDITKRYISFISPIAIGLLGIVILVVALAIMAPVLDIMSVL